MDLFLLGGVGLVLLGFVLADGWLGRCFGFIGALGLYGSYACLLGLYGRTFGKALFGLQVVRADGSRAGFLRSVLIREGLRLVFVLLQVGNLVDLALLFRDDRRTVHDFASDTIVIYKPLRSASNGDR